MFHSFSVRSSGGFASSAWTLIFSALKPKMVFALSSVRPEARRPHLHPYSHVPHILGRQHASLCMHNAGVKSGRLSSKSLSFSVVG
jgi:hypothetical protein